MNNNIINNMINSGREYLWFAEYLDTPTIYQIDEDNKYFNFNKLNTHNMIKFGLSGQENIFYYDVLSGIFTINDNNIDLLIGNINITNNKDFNYSNCKVFNRGAYDVTINRNSIVGYYFGYQLDNINLKVGLYLTSENNINGELYIKIEPINNCNDFNNENILLYINNDMALNNIYKNLCDENNKILVRLM